MRRGWRARSAGLLLGCLVLMAAGRAGALPLLSMPDFQDRPGPELYELYNLLAGTSFGANSDLMPFLVSPDETWVLGSRSGVVLVGSDLGMANMNSFGFYTDLGTGQALTEIFSMVGPLGVAGPVFQAASFGVEGEVGFYLDAWGLNDDLWHSQSDIDTADTAFDHMATFELPDGIVLETTLGLIRIDDGALIGWEDLDDASPKLDGDYNDMMVVVGTFTVIPEPATGALVALGLVVFVTRSRRFRALRG